MPAPDLVVDLFAGPGGWSTGITDLLTAHGLTEVALELDDAACRTRRANGHTTTVRTDVAAYPLAPFRGRTVGLLGSPPCQPFSLAGKQGGTAHVDSLAAGAYDVTLGRRPLADVLADLTADGTLTDTDGAYDPRASLILEPARWITGLGDTLQWVALEQVPMCRPIYTAYAHALRQAGWRTALVAKLNAADYGVPQTRERVFLLAHRTRVVELPEPTHARGGTEPDLFGPGRLPWLSMARALGWGLAARPSVTLTARTHDENGKATGGVRPLDGGSGARATIAREAAAGRFILDRRQTGVGPVDVGVEPCPTMTTTAVGKGVWTVEDRLNAGEADDAGPRQSAPGSLRILEAEGAILQGFPAEYVWYGTKGKRWEQIGNVVCPPVARRVVGALLGDPDPAPLPWHTYAHARAADDTDDGPALRVGNRPGSTVRRASEPAPTLVAGGRVNDIAWEPDADEALARRARREARRAE